MTNRIELSITHRSPFAAAHEFGPVGAYERLVGRANFSVDPETASQRGITDLDKAATDACGLVHFSGDFSILKPADPARCNRRLFFDYGNRGNKRTLQFFNDAPVSNDSHSLAHARNGFLMRRGYTVAWLAWQGDLLPGNGRMLLDLPVASDRNGAITGPVRVEYIADRPRVTTLPLSGRVSVRSHLTVSLDPREAQLTRRRYPYDERTPVPPEYWCFARVEGGTGLDSQGAVHAVIPSDNRFDREHIAEKIEDLGKSERDTVRSQIRLIIEHFLKLAYSPAEDRSLDWIATIIEARQSLSDKLTPTLRQDAEATLDKLYADGRKQAAVGPRRYGEEEPLSISPPRALGPLTVSAGYPARFER
jgi:uncharacterized protein DUF29